MYLKVLFLRYIYNLLKVDLLVKKFSLNLSVIAITSISSIISSISIRMSSSIY